MASVSFRNVKKSFGKVEVLHGVGFDIADGEFVVLVGPSGCGKSTLLRMLAGLEEISAGEIAIDDRVVNDLDAKDRDIAMVFQSYALYPHMTVRENMGFSLRLRKAAQSEIDARVANAARILNLDQLLHRYPRELSGGQRQRVAMGRAIVREADAFLFDEPLSNLDAKLRVQARTQIASLTRRLGVTTVYVTHDQVEAMTMGDRVAVLKDGHLMQVDTPRALYDRPATEFVAGFIGSPAMNLFRVPVSGGAATFGTMSLQLTAAQQAALTSDKVTVGIRPEDLHPAAQGTGLPIEADVVEELGADAFLYAVPDDPSLSGLISQAVVRLDGRPDLTKGERVRLVIDPLALHVFDTASGERLSA